MCFTCGFRHTSDADCKSTFPNRDPKASPKGCLHHGVPVNHAICKHNDESGSDKAIPMMEIDIQVHPTGCSI